MTEPTRPHDGPVDVVGRAQHRDLPVDSGLHLRRRSHVNRLSGYTSRTSTSPVRAASPRAKKKSPHTSSCRTAAPRPTS